jgi:AcrR family transcriptional regulator
MVSQPLPPGTRERLFAAAAHEFSARGFDGAKVDRIAARARVNKAMLYYHFKSKAALYREILRDMFSSVAEAVIAAHAAGGTPDTQLRAYVRAIADQAQTRPHFPPMWLREIAEGGRHLDASIVGEMRRVVETLAAILREGREAGLFADVNPFITQVTIVAPLMLFIASAPVRERFHHLIPHDVAAASPELAIAHIQRATLAAIAAPAPASRPASRPRSRPA